MDNETKVWTVAELREALAKCADDMLVVVSVPVDEDSYAQYAITGGPRHDEVDWGDGRGMVADERYVALDAFTSCLPLRSALEFSDS